MASRNALASVIHRLTLFAVLTGALALAEPTPLERARALYLRTEYNQALELLKSARDPQSLLLAGQSWFMLGEFKNATEVLDKAALADPRSSKIQHWLGKAYGRRAETSSFLTAPRFASRCRHHFEKAVELDPNNVEAMNDLLEYYLEAPGILGGGLDKAQVLAEKIGGKDAAEKHYALARLAEKRKEFNTAEQHLRRASELAPQQVGRVIDLARFLAKQGKVSESDAAFQRAAKLAPNHPKVLFSQAQAYVESKRNLDQARRLLETYLKSELTPDDPPKEEAERLLRLARGS
jgi:Flp pilus assembly protein TadD